LRRRDRLEVAVREHLRPASRTTCALCRGASSGRNRWWRQLTPNSVAICAAYGRACGSLSVSSHAWPANLIWREPSLGLLLASAPDLSTSKIEVYFSSSKRAGRTVDAKQRPRLNTDPTDPCRCAPVSVTP
jgi:hypothetical protein